MKQLVLGLILGFVTSLIAGEVTLSNEQKLKAENLQLKIALTQCQVTVSTNTLGSERQKLIEEFRAVLGAKPEAEFDWQSLTFKDKKDK